MLHAKIIDVTKEKIDIENAQKFIASSKCGASIYFVGTVRDQNNDKKVTGIAYDSHDVLVIKSFEKIYKEAETKFKYLFYYLKSNRGIRELSKAISGSGQPKMNKTDLRKIKVLLPTIKEQTQITKILSEVDAKIEKEEATKAQLEHLKKGLMQVLLTGKVRVKA